MITPDHLKQAKDFESLAALFYSELGWPEETWQTIPGVAEIYDIDLQGAKSIEAVRPFEEGQDWGIFLIDFGNNPLKRKDLRSALTKLAEKNRHTHDNPVWKHEKLLFICRHAGTSGVSPDSPAFTFAYFTGDKLANAKLRTFGWDDPSRARTALTRNLPKLHWDQRENWHEAWDAEALTKEFFRDYKTVFEGVEASVVGLKTPEDKRRFTQTLFNRLMFLAFLQEKGWLQYPEGNRRDAESTSSTKDYLHRLFENWKPVEGKDPEPRFYSRLRYLFFSGLNSPNGIGGDRKGLEEKIGKVPFLNGGLFEPSDTLDRNDIHVPDDSIKAILELFKRYTLTVTESTPLDVEVALDPEMLGKIFEELVTGRHESGSYYTPRPIVQFMCREGIKGYLSGTSGVSPVIEKLVDEHDTEGIEVNEAKQIVEKLERIKVCDPACGSGAYLLGMLQELHALQVILDTTAHQKDARDDYERKLKIIRDCIYGVDIDPFAINIAWLRLWLSLVIDDQSDPHKDDVSLPNLDAKIAIGDSVMGVGAVDTTLAGNAIQDFIRARNDYIDADTKPEKERLKRQMDEAKDAVRFFAKKSDTDPENAFHWAVEFMDVFAAKGDSKPGFDVVVANPPYLRQEVIKQQFGDAYKKALVKAYPNCGSGTADLLVYFYDRALQLLAPGGTLAFISSNKWLRAAYGEKLRNHLASNASLDSITDFGDLPVFEAIAYPMILVARNETPSAQTPLYTDVKSLDEPYPDVKALIASQGFALPPDSIAGADWMLADQATLERLRKMKASGTPLGEYVGGKIYHGIQTSLNDIKVSPDGRFYNKYQSAPKGSHREGVFVISDERRAEILKRDPSSTLFIRPVLTGSDIRRWRAIPCGEWLVTTPIGFPLEAYPGIAWHMNQYRAPLEARSERGPNWWELRACVYYEVFEEPYIVYPDIATEGRFALAPAGTYLNNTGNLLGSGDPYTLAILNSSQALEWFQSVSSEIQNGFMRYIHQHVETIPIPNASSTDREAVAALVQSCLDAKAANPDADVSEYEAEIDARVEFLYFHRDPEAGIDTYDQWVAQKEAEKGTIIEEIRNLIVAGESGGVEFKQSLEAPDLSHSKIANAPDNQKPTQIGEAKKDCIHSVLKTIGAFRNRKEGGTLLIGIHDNGSIIGLQPDYDLLRHKPNKDGFENKLTDLIKSRINPIPTDLDIAFATIDGKEVCRITVAHGLPTYVDNKLYVRLGNSSEELTGRHLQDWLAQA